MPIQQEQQDERQESQGSRLTPIQFPEGYVPGRYAPWYCSPEPIYGPDELGEYANAIEEMTHNVNRTDSAARIWEVLQAWEARLFRRGYHFLTAGWKGWGMFGGSSGTSGASIMQSQNSMKLFSCNVFGARHDKIVAALCREVPGVAVVAKDDHDPMDQSAAEEAEKYLKVFIEDANLKKAVTQAASLFYTDDRVGFLTYTVADESRWGTETVNDNQKVYGAPEDEGVSPETEGEEHSGEEQPARKEITEVFGKLETKVPILCDEEHEMGWIRFQKERSVNLLREKYPWIEDKIATQGNVGGMDQIDRLARINSRLAVQASSSSGEAWKNDATETVTFFKPSEYRLIKDKDVRQVFYDEFPDGLEVWHAGGQLAMVRNCRASRHVKIIHCYPGDGQNRRAIGTNYLPLQKILNANISLLDRYFRAAVPRRFAMEPYIDTQLLNSQSNDPAKITPVTGLEGKNLAISQITGIENVPSPNDAIFQFVQWLIQGAPEAMDGATPTMFGESPGGQDQGVFQTARLNRDQALQIYSMPWASLCEAIACVCLQAVESAAENRKANISASLPGQTRLEVEIEKLQGNVLVYPESLEIPRSLAEQEEQIARLIEQSSSVALYQQIVNDPRNLSIFAKFPSIASLEIPGADAVEEQSGEFEILMQSGPIPNPKMEMIQEQLQKGMNDPEAQAPEGQQALSQLQQMAKTLPPLISTVPVAQDTSENHAVHAAVTLGMLNSPTGRKLKNGNEEQKAIWQNLKLHWQEHMTVLKQLQPPPQVEMKANVSIDPSKLPPAAQSKAFQALGLEVSPQDLTPEEVTHEITTEKQGIDESGVPVKQKVSVVGKPL